MTASRRSREHDARRVGRRELLGATGSAGLLAILAGCMPPPPPPGHARPIGPPPPTRPSSPSPKPPSRPLALVYRGPASCPGCSEAVAALLAGCPTPFRTAFVGPGEDLTLSAATLAAGAVYAQPGGGNVDSGWQQLRGHAQVIRDFVRRGGNYLGFCLGGYLAGSTPGFGLLPGDASQYANSPGATVRTTEDTVTTVTWGDRLRYVYFQDGPRFDLAPGAPATVLATYPTGAPAAVVTTYGAGRVGVVGPHPEADEGWYRAAGLTNPGGVEFDLGYDLIDRTLHPR